MLEIRLFWFFPFSLSGNFLPICCLRDDDWRMEGTLETKNIAGGVLEFCFLLFGFCCCCLFTHTHTYIHTYIYILVKKLLFFYPHLCLKAPKVTIIWREGGVIFSIPGRFPPFLANTCLLTPHSFWCPMWGSRASTGMVKTE